MKFVQSDAARPARVRKVAAAEAVDVVAAVTLIGGGCVLVAVPPQGRDEGPVVGQAVGHNRDVVAASNY